MPTEGIYSFQCLGCPATMLLPAEKLGNIFAHPNLRLIDAASVGIVCPHCKLVGSYSLFENSPDYNHADEGRWGRPLGDAEFQGWLKCEMKSCTTPLPLFAIWNATTTEEERKIDISTWKWENLHCPNGHTIEAPIE